MRWPIGKLRAIAVAFYQSQPKQNAATDDWFEFDDFDDGDVEIWPENAAAFSLFCNLQTQWRVGMSGVTGFDYPAVYPLLDRATDNPQDWDQMLADLQVMELAAIAEINSKT